MIHTTLNDQCFFRFAANFSPQLQETFLAYFACIVKTSPTRYKVEMASSTSNQSCSVMAHNSHRKKCPQFNSALPLNLDSAWTLPFDHLVQVVVVYRLWRHKIHSPTSGYKQLFYNLKESHNLKSLCMTVTFLGQDHTWSRLFLPGLTTYPRLASWNLCASVSFLGHHNLRLDWGPKFTLLDTVDSSKACVTSFKFKIYSTPS